LTYKEKPPRVVDVQSNQTQGVPVLLRVDVTTPNATDARVQTDAPLAAYSERDRAWDKHRGQAVDVEAIYAQAREFEHYAARITDCAGVLRFRWADDPTTGESRLRLREARFCRVRYCPVCQWRRSLMQQARFLQALPAILEQYPRHRWLLLTLTVKNCPIDALRNTLQGMNRGWQRLIKRPEFQPVAGWIRSTEVTRGKDGSAHPHFHCLLMVPPSMLAKNYVTQARWTELWAECARLDYKPVVDVRAVREKKDGAAASIPGAIEVLKYAVKPGDMTGNPDWFLELTRQTHKLRFLAAGGVLKDALRDTEKASDADMVHAGDADADGDDDGSRIAFSWRPADRKYRRYRKGDKAAK